MISTLVPNACCKINVNVAYSLIWGIFFSRNICETYFHTKSLYQSRDKKNQQRSIVEKNESFIALIVIKTMCQLQLVVPGVNLMTLETRNEIADADLCWESKHLADWKPKVYLLKGRNHLSIVPRLCGGCHDKKNQLHVVTVSQQA